jgi:hypothetical protein
MNPMLVCQLRHCFHILHPWSLAGSADVLARKRIGDREPVGLLYPAGDGDGQIWSPRWGMGTGTRTLLLHGDGGDKEVPERGQTR